MPKMLRGFAQKWIYLTLAVCACLFLIQHANFTRGNSKTYTLLRTATLILPGGHFLADSTLEQEGITRPLNASSMKIALVLGITSNKIADKGEMQRVYTDDVTIRQRFPFMNQLVPSFCRTASPGFRYTFYLAFDRSDAFFAEVEYVTHFVTVFRNITTRECGGIDVSLRLIKCNHSGKPAWAQNDAAMEAYMDDAEYFYRLNDDMTMASPRWTEELIETLLQMDPPNVGVTAPFGARPDIFTFEFVHKTHIDIFGYYYPREFPDWHCDAWITNVYKPNNSNRTISVQVDHNRILGQRYRHARKLDEQLTPGQLLDQVTMRDSATLLRYTNMVWYSKKAKREIHREKPDNAIVMPLLPFTEKRVLLNVMRDAVLFKTFMPSWTFKIYLKQFQITNANKINNTLNVVDKFHLNLSRNNNIVTENGEQTILKESIKQELQENNQSAVEQNQTKGHTTLLPGSYVDSILTYNTATRMRSVNQRMLHKLRVLGAVLCIIPPHINDTFNDWKEFVLKQNQVKNIVITAAEKVITDKELNAMFTRYTKSEPSNAIFIT